MLRLALSCVIAGGVLTAATHAGSVTIEAGTSGALTIHSAPILGVFGTDTPFFTSGALNTVHDALHDGGISTDGVITILFAHTDHGFPLMTLVDDDAIGGIELPGSILGVDSTVTGGSSTFIGDGLELFEYEAGSGGSQMMTELFIRDSDHRGDAIAWAGLGFGDEGHFDFVDIAGSGMDGEQAFQFVTFTGEEWEIAGSGSWTGHHFSMSFAVIPLPPAVMLGAAGLAGVLLGRRRRRG